MSEEHLLVLLVDDEASLRTPLARYLSNMYGYHVDTAANEEEAWERVLRAERPYDVALIDDLLAPKPGTEPKPIGVKLMTRIQERCPETECIIFTGWGMDRALEALQAGAYRYLAKPLNLDELGMTIRMAAEQGRLRQERDLLSATLEISRAMLSELDVGKTLEVIAEAVPKLVGVEACAVALLDHAAGKVRYDPIIPLGDATVKWHRHLREVQLTKQITEMGEPFVLSDVAAEAKRVDENLRLAGVKSFAGVPIPGEPQNLGVLYAYSTRREAFGTHERRVLQLLSGQAAIALENAHLFADTQKSAQRSEALYRTSHALSFYLEEEPVIRAILEAVYRTLGCEHVLISTVDDEAETIGIRHGIWHGKFDVFPEWIEMAQYSLDHPDILTDIYRTGRTEIIKGWDDRFNREIYDEFGHEGLLRIFMPIKTRDKVIGVVEVGYDKREKGHISEDEVQLLAAFMDQAAVALENARLFSQLSEAEERLDGLIASSLDSVIAIDQNKKITVFNRRAEEMFGWTAKEMEGRSVARLYGDFGKAQEIYEVVNREGTIAGWEIVLKHKDGTRIPALLSATLIRDSQGNPIGQAGFMRDLRQVNLLAERLQALIRVSQAITVTLELDKVLNLIVESAVAAFPAAQSGAIHLYDERADILRVRAITRDYSAEALRALNLRVGEGIAGWVFQNQQPLVVDDAGQAPHYKRIDHPEVQVHRSMICVPLRVRERMIGTLSLSNSDVTGAFQPEDLGLLASFADQAAIAIDNARRMHELEHMRRVAKKLASVISVQEALQQIVRSAREILGVDSAVIWSYDAVRHTFLPDELVAEGIKPELVEKFRGDEPHPGGTAEMVMQQEYLAVTDIYDPKYTFLGPTARGLRGEIGVQAFQGIALKVGGERLGVLYVNYNRVRTFDGDEEATLRVFASHAALALKNARLLEQVRRAIDAAKVVAEVSILGDLEQTLHSVVKGTQEVLDCDAVVLFVYNQVTNKLDHPPTMMGVRYRDRASRYGEVLTDSIVYEMLRQDEPYIVEAVAQDPLFRDRRFAKDEGVESCVAIPLKALSQKVGVMFVNYRSRHRFTTDELINVNLFAHQAAVAIRNAQLYEETIERANTLEVLYEAGKAVTSTLALDEILNRIVEQARHLTGHCGKQALFSDLELVEGNRLKGKAAYPPEHLVGHQRTVGEIDLEHDERIGVIGRAAKTGQSQLVGDVTQDSDYIEYDPETCSELAVPIKVGEQVIGVINIEHPDYNAFDEDDRRDLESLAAQAAIAIENARLFREIEHRALQLTAASEVARDATAILDVERLLDETVRRISERFGFYHAGVFLVDDKGEYAVLQAASSEGGRRMLERGYKLKVGEVGIVGFVTGSGEPRVALDVGKDAVHFVNPDLPDTRSEMALPFTVRGQVIGALDVQSTEVRAFTDGDVAALQTMAGQLANAIRNAQLYEETIRRAEALRALYEAGKAVTSTLALDEILNRIVEQARQITGRYGEQACVSYLALKEGSELKFKATWPPGLLAGREDVGIVDLEHGGFIGIAGRAVKTGQSQLVGDVTQDPDYICYDPETRSELAVPIKLEEEVIGVINVEHPYPNAFDEEDRHCLEFLAAQAAIAIQNARQFRLRDGLLKAGEVVTAEGELYPALEIIAQSVKETIVCDVVSLYTYDQKKREISYPSVVTGKLHKPQEQANWQLVSQEKKLHVDLLGEHSVIRKLLEYGSSRFAFCSIKDSILGAGGFAAREGIESSAAILLKVGEEVVGILFVNYRSAHHFSDGEKQAAELFAVQAALTIQSARRYEELKNIKGFVGARTAIDWMRMVSTAWGHGIRREVGTVLGHMALLRGLLDKGGSVQEIEKELDQLENVIKGVKEIPITAPLSYEDEIDSVQINELVKTHLERQWTHVRYKPVRLCPDLQKDLDSIVTVRASREWLRRALEIPVDNSVQAMLEADSPEKRLTVTTRLVGEMVEISVRDTGPGIPEDVLEKLFEEPIHKPVGSRGAGIGLMLAQTIVQTYGGDIRVELPADGGTNVVIILPVEDKVSK